MTQTPNRPRKHEGFDRTGDFCSRVKLSQDLAQVINDGLSCYGVILIFSLYKHNILVEDLRFEVFSVKKIDIKKFVKALGDISQDLTHVMIDGLS